MSSERRLCEDDFDRLEELVRQSVSTCYDCAGEMVDFCMERCCSLSPMFCRHCSVEHLAHRTNCLLMLFSGRNLYPNKMKIVMELENHKCRFTNHRNAVSLHNHAAEIGSAL